MNTASRLGIPADTWAKTDRIVRGTPHPRFISLRVLAERWDCDRTTVRRNLDTGGVKAFCLGHGKHGIVRYLFQDIEDYERRCREP